MAVRRLKRFELPSSLLFPEGWQGTVPDLRALQQQLAPQVSLDDAHLALPRWVAGVDVGLARLGKQARAAAVLFDTQAMQPVAQVVVEQPVALPYIPGLLSFRELPAVLTALGQLPRPPALVLCDGQGIAHPRRFGIAAHLGIATGLPCIGVAKSVLVGEYRDLPLEKGGRVPLRIDGEIVGSVLRTRARCLPLVVSPGHRVGIDRAADFVLSLVTRYRLPEPTRLADRSSKAGSGSRHADRVV